MWQDVSYLRRFYATPLGHIARRLIRSRLRELWPETAGQRVLAIGYGTPYMRPFQESAERTVAVMPALQGVTHWPSGGPGLVTLSEEDALPFPDNAFDRVLLVHAVESSEQLRRMLREVWRVLAGEGHDGGGVEPAGEEGAHGHVGHHLAFHGAVEGGTHGRNRIG